VLLGRRVLSNLLELSPDDPTLLRMYAWRMQQAGELDEAIAAFERVRGRRADEPQSHRDLALALEARWQRDGDVADARRAIALFYAVSTRSWDRFPEIELNALMELNRLLYLANAAGIPTPENIDPRLIRLLDLDVRISMSWDADLTDVDLHVFEPTGDHAYYGNNRTSIGGLVSRDVQDGYGPEEYLLRRSKPGEYTIKAHYFGSHQQTLTGPCTVIVAVFTNYARPNEERQLLTLRLERAGNEFVVGTIRIGTVGSETDWRTLFRTLRLGMSINEIVAVVGQPAELRAGDEMALIYRPAAGVEIHVRASPRLTCVQQRTEGAVLDLV
jgi:Ca-activated chloride channel family protein